MIENEVLVSAPWRTAAEQLIALVSAHRDELRAALRLETWKAASGMHPPAGVPAVSGEWEDAVIPYSWSPRDYDKTFHYPLKFEAGMSGVDLRGSRVTIELWAPIGGQVFVNGEHVYSGEYWADTQVVPIVLTEALDGPAAFDIVLQCRQGDGFGYFYIADLTVSAIDEQLFQLDLLAEELSFSLFLAGRDPEGELQRVLAKAIAAFDVSALERRDWTFAAREASSIRSRLTVFEPYAKQFKVFMAGHAHIDMNWLWPQAETEDLIRRDFESMDSIMEQFPDVCFSHSQAVTYQIMQDKQPELWARIKRRIAEGRWEVTASTWVEGDLNMAGYETLARQFLEGKSYCREQLGADPEICWEPDTFGHPATMPQVLRQAGIKYYYHMRPARDVPVYWWEGIDGSRVLAFNDPRSYFGRVYPSLVIPDSIRMAEQFGLSCNLHVYGIGDHGGGVTRSDVGRAVRMRESKLLPQIIFAPTVEYYKEVERSGVELPVIRGELNPLFEGCYTSHGDIKRANRQTEHLLVRAETMAASAAAYARSSGRGGTAVETAARLRLAWRTQCFNQFHDIVCGCSVHSTYVDAIPAASAAAAAAVRVSEEAAGAAYMKAETADGADVLETSVEPDGASIVIWNSLSWSRTDAVMLANGAYPRLAGWQTGDRLVAGDGVASVVQRTGEGLLFIARDVPGLGFKRYSYESAGAENGVDASAGADAKADANARANVEASAEGSAGADARVDGIAEASAGANARVDENTGAKGSAGAGANAGARADVGVVVAAGTGAAGSSGHEVRLSKSGNPVLVGDRFTVEIDRESGTIVGLTDRLVGRELSYTPPDAGVESNQTKGLMNLFEVQYEAPHWMSAWKLGTISGTKRLIAGADVTIGEQGPVMQSVQVTHRFDNSVLRQEIRVYRGIDRIDFLHHVDWGELGGEKVDSPTLRVLFTPKLQGTSHTFDVPFGAIERYPDGREVPANHWIDLSGNGYGLSLLNDSKYGHSMHENTLGMTLIRSSSEPDNRSDFSKHQFAFAIVPHEGDWRDAGTVHRAWEFNQPMFGAVSGEGLGPEDAAWGALRLLAESPSSPLPHESAIVTAFKQSQSGGDWIVRIAETAGRRSTVTLETAFAVESAALSNLLEDTFDTLQVAKCGEGAGLIALGELGPWEIRTIRLTVRGG